MGKNVLKEIVYGNSGRKETKKEESKNCPYISAPESNRKDALKI